MAERNVARLLSKRELEAAYSVQIINDPEVILELDLLENKYGASRIRVVERDMYNLIHYHAVLFTSRRNRDVPATLRIENQKVSSRLDLNNA